MTTQDVLNDLQVRGVEFQAALRWRPRNAVTNGEREFLAANKLEILQLLTGQDHGSIRESSNAEEALAAGADEDSKDAMRVVMTPDGRRVFIFQDDPVADSIPW